MNTQILDWTDKEKAAAILRQGGIVCFPTETVFGMGAIASDENAFHALAELKKRPPEKPFTLMCANFTQAAQYAEIDVRSLAVMHAFMPGEITLLLHPRQNVPFWITLGSPFIGIRIPGDQNVREMIEKVGSPRAKRHRVWGPYSDFNRRSSGFLSWESRCGHPREMSLQKSLDHCDLRSGKTDPCS